MRTALPAAIVVVLTAFPTGFARSDDATRLRWQFEKGAKPAYTITQDVSSSMDMGVQKAESSQKAIFGYTYEVTAKEDDVAQVEMTYDRVKMALKAPIGEIEYDSSDPEKGSQQAGPLAGLFEVFDALVGAPFKISLDKDGRLASFKMPEAVSQKVSAVPGAMAGSFGEDGMRQTVSLAFLPTPSKAVEKGDTWNHQQAVTTPMGKLSYDTTYTYLGADTVGGANLEKIGVKTTVSLEPSPQTPFDVKIVKQESEGTAFFDNNAGRLHSLDEVIKMDLEVSVAGNSMVQSLEMAYKIAQGEVGAAPQATPSEGEEKK